MLERLPSKQHARVRFPSPALAKASGMSVVEFEAEVEETQKHAAVAQLVERVLGKDEVTGPTPVSSFSASRHFSVT